MRQNFNMTVLSLLTLISWIVLSRAGHPDACYGHKNTDELMSTGGRIVIVVDTLPWSGSTAMTQLIMSSPSVSTLCKGAHWQCEGHEIPAALRDYGHHIINITKTVLSWLKIWDLSKPFLLTKAFGISGNFTSELANTLQGLDASFLPTGITKLYPVWLTMWRPMCLMLMSSGYLHSFEAIKGSTQADEENALRQFHSYEHARLLDLAYAIRKLQQQRIPMLTISYGTLLWKSNEIAKIISKWLSCCSDEFRDDFRPRLGHDVFVRNRWKTTGTLQDYGKKKNPKDYGYDVNNIKCDSKPVLNPKQLTSVKYITSKLIDLEKTLFENYS
eukprot:m.345677 g.345677  ORF g.345677 m.345677 type:complete len:329 (+) comp26984_c0_seq1:220-1206(+)